MSKDIMGENDPLGPLAVNDLQIFPGLIASDKQLNIPYRCYNWKPILILAFPADIGRKPVSPARGSRQRLHAG